MTKKRVILISVLAGLAASVAAGQGKPPTPPKPDVPFLIHATSLLETESNTAVELEKKKELLYTIQGPSSGVETPMARPEFVIRAENLNLNGLRLYRFESQNGHREILLRKKKKLVARAYFLSVDALGEGVFRIRVDDVLDNGEYCLTPDGSNDVFCFTVF